MSKHLKKAKQGENATTAITIVSPNKCKQLVNSCEKLLSLLQGLLLITTFHLEVHQVFLPFTETLGVVGISSYVTRTKMAPVSLNTSSGRRNRALVLI